MFDPHLFFVIPNTQTFVLAHNELQANFPIQFPASAPAVGHDNASVACRIFDSQAFFLAHSKFYAYVTFHADASALVACHPQATKREKKACLTPLSFSVALPFGVTIRTFQGYSPQKK